MNNYRIINICEKPELKEIAAAWFHSKWQIPIEEYLTSITEALKQTTAVPAWYLCLDNDKIIAGLGVIENDFHKRKDLAPNICAVYTEEEYRSQGIAGQLLNFACKDMKSKNIDTLYLITEHIGFYERYSWEFFCLVEEDNEDANSNMLRMYVHKEV